MAAFPAMPLFTDAYLADTHPDLNLEEHGCYMLLLQAAWRRPHCDLPDDDAWFCKFLGIHGNKWRVLRAKVLERFWTFDPDRRSWWQKRLRKERDFVEKSSRNRSENGKKGNAVRWGNNDLGDRPAIAPTPTPTPILKEEDSRSKRPICDDLIGDAADGARAEKSPDFPQPPLPVPRGFLEEPVPPITPPRPPARQKKPPADPGVFDRFWEACPRKVGKKDAERKFCIAARDVDPDRIISAMQRFAAAERAKGTEERYISHPATWLSKGRWDDVVAPVVSIIASRPAVGTPEWNRLPDWKRQKLQREMWEAAAKEKSAIEGSR